MMKRIFLLIVPFILLLAAEGLAAEVSQGKCINHDKEKQTITMEEYDIKFDKEFPYGHPTGKVSVYHIGKALIGLAPKPGDILRIAYEPKGSENMASKVMNVSKQDLRKK